MAKRSDRLQLVKELAERKKQQADQFLAASRARTQQDQQSLQQLQNFLLEYQQQFQQAGQRTLGPSEMQTRQAFMQKITKAIEQHRKGMAQNQQELVAVEQHWQKSYAHLKAMEVLQAKAVDQERAQADKQLQKELDERSQRRPPDFF
ncbi:flagellar export protein FliJ [Marinobacterium arenosum]|uniref:flagellar export protein FliJ n=1 Tax=Marinobacterium arenosum TaxID=2862496 RepID=UPI001C978522|nr:flagellar export protein FliJ [Marinobacterium arenosum]MBY4675949.1 flagellar export protein FliJ [Marinobacterium arenosum]